MVKLLVERGADVNSRVFAGGTVRHWMVVGDKELRLESSRTDSEWRSPLSMARAGGFEDVIAYLLSVGARD